MAGETIRILDGSTFVVSDRRGDIDAAPDQPHGCSSAIRASCRGGRSGSTAGI
jgi:hypothetical protein